MYGCLNPQMYGRLKIENVRVLKTADVRALKSGRCTGAQEVRMLSNVRIYFISLATNFRLAANWQSHWEVRIIAP